MQLIETDRRGHGSIFSEAEFLKKQNYSEKESYGKLQQIVEGNTKMATSNQVLMYQYISKPGLRPFLGNKW